MHVRTLLALWVILVLPAAADPARSFAAALERDDVRAFAQPALLPARDFIERHACAHVDHAGTIDTLDDGTLLVAIEGHAITAGAPAHSVAIPSPWRLRVDANGEILEAEPELHAVARQLALTGDRALLAGRDDLAELARVVGFRFQGLENFTAAAHALIEESRAAGDLAAQSECFRNLATHTRLEDNPRARQYAHEALALARAAASADAEANALFTLGLMHWVSDEPDEALDWYLRSAALAERAEDPRFALKALHMASVLEGRRGRQGQVLMHGQRLLALSRRFGWQEGELTALLSAQGAHGELRQHDIAARIGREVYALSQHLGLTGHVKFAEANLAQNEADRGNYEEAAALLARARRIRMPWHDHAALDLTESSVHERRGRIDEAEQAARCAIDHAQRSRDQRIVSDALVRLSELMLARGDACAALDLASSAEQLRPGTVTGSGYSRFLPWAAPTARGRALAALGRTDEAARALESAIATIEDIRARAATDELARTMYLEDKTDPYRALVRLYVEEGRTREALRIADRIQGRTLADVAGHPGVDLAAWMTPAERKREQELEERLAAANGAALAARSPDAMRAAEATVAAARVDLRRFRTELYATHPELHSRRAANVDDDVEVPRSLGDVAIVQYAIADGRVLAFVLVPGKTVRAVEIAAREDELRARIEAAMRKLQTRDVRYAGEARALHRMLVAPLPADVLRHEAVCIIPDDVLWQVPFQALLGADGRYVVERTALFYAPSLAMLRRMAEAETRNDGMQLLALANPLHAAGAVSEVRALFGGVDLGPLPEAESEVQALGRLYGASRSRVYVGSAARESLMKSGTARSTVLHIATHAFADPQAPLFSALLLAPGPGGEDGLLEAREIAELDLDVSLVVLSACDTARGGIAAGEGVVGLSWAFFAAGVPTAVVSQWKATSRATERLMVDFHRHLLGGRPPAAALRLAQLAMMREARYHAPFYWAPFTVVGRGWAALAQPPGLIVRSCCW